MTSAHQLLDVVIVTHNSSAVLGTALYSLGLSDSPAAQLIVIDNASRPEERLATRQMMPPGTILVENSVNVGFAGAVNQGVGMSASPWIFLLNPDCSVTTEVLRALMFHAQEAEIEIVAPIVATHSPKGVLPAGMAPSAWRFFVQYCGLAFYAGHRVRLLRGFNLYERNVIRGAPSGQREEVDWVSGGCMLVSRILWNRLNGLNPRWFMYGEDVDFCRRARELGVPSYIIPQLRAAHPLGTGSTERNPRVRMSWLRNLRDIVLEQHGRMALFRLDAVLLFGAVLVSVTRRRSSFGRPGVTLLWRCVLRSDVEPESAHS